jgi:hypothetical protein
MRLSRGLVTALAGLSFVGCSGDGIETPETVPAGGAVMYKGSPVVGATVSFMAEGAPKAAVGMTNDKGEFQLSTFGANDGAIVGQHSITVVKVVGEATQAPSNPREMMGRPGAMADTYQQRLGNQGNIEGPKSELPEKYAKAETSGLKETVTAEGPNKFVLQLTD